jgi:hypothetical protein
VRPVDESVAAFTMEGIVAAAISEETNDDAVGEFAVLGLVVGRMI